jgi:hypothetical protein
MHYVLCEIFVSLWCRFVAHCSQHTHLQLRLAYFFKKASARYDKRHYVLKSLCRGAVQTCHKDYR